MPATETGLIARWLYSTLTGDATLAAAVPGGWHRSRAPATAALPFGIIRLQGGFDLNVSGAARVLVEAVYAVYAVGANAQALETASARIDALLHQQAAIVTGGRILACVRETPVELSLLENGVARETAGGTYRIHAQRS